MSAPTAIERRPLLATLDNASADQPLEFVAIYLLQGDQP
jgi:hypothetical protein